MLLVATASASSMMPSLSKTAKAQGDGRMAAVACCGADRSASIAALGSGTVLKGPTPVAVLDAASSVSDGALAVAASQVVLLEVRVADLVERGPNGLDQLRPLLQRSLRLSPTGPKKLLLLAVVDAESSELSEGAVSALAAQQLEELWGGLGVPEGASAFEDALELQCVFLPHPKAAQFASSVEQLKARFADAGASAYLFSDGRYTANAAALLESAESLNALPAPAQSTPESPAAVHAAYTCLVALDGATKEFQKGLSALKKAADASVVPDFGEQASALLDDALDKYDAATEALKPHKARAASRDALKANLRRALLPPFRKQVSALQKQTLAKFRQKLAALRPSAEVEVELAALRKDLTMGYEAQAEQLAPADKSLGFSDVFERRELYETFVQGCQAHVENLRVQGLYLPTKRVVFPVDFSAHWLMLNPFGKDARYDAVGPGDKPLFRPTASPMRLRATGGYKPSSQLQDPKRMVFTDKMMK